ncbi:hypothetical protein Cch01nite_40460 [Cellulomonas chitinilytica]|uniref:Uncharacterized protein n=1 Tax=Cellulomonas chitinilytica TaxID=398759 RepID=A0A919P4P3_9CELL|nr:hypothetical protein Cch01nite_40460 [Cellulomonas chitinilytica]
MCTGPSRQPLPNKLLGRVQLRHAAGLDGACCEWSAAAILAALILDADSLGSVKHAEGFDPRGLLVVDNLAGLGAEPTALDYMQTRKRRPGRS